MVATGADEPSVEHNCKKFHRAMVGNIAGLSAFEPTGDGHHSAKDLEGEWQSILKTGFRAGKGSTQLDKAVSDLGE